MRQSIGMFLCGLLLAGASSATAAVEFGIDASHRGPEIGKLYYGIFFEEINHAGNGGIYAELVRNRSFEDNTGNPDFNGNNGRGWSGTGFTATNKGVAEFYNTTFDAYQELPYMPASEYTLTCSGFYRNGGKEVYNVFNTDGSYAGNTVTLTLDKTSTLRLGVRKSIHCDRDWTCFDNFRLTYTPDGSGMTGIALNDDVPVNVYSLEGILLRRDVRRADATAGLAPGLYIVGHTKVAVR